MGKQILGFILSLMAAFFTIQLVEKLGHAFYPPPPGLDYNNPDPNIINTYFEQIPIGSLIFVVLAYVLGSIAAGITLRVFNAKGIAITGSLLALFLTLAGLINLLLLPQHPAWFWVLSLIAFAPATYLGIRLGSKFKIDPEAPMPN